MTALHLYGKLRRFATEQSPRAASILRVRVEPGERLGDLVDRLGIPREELGSNLFVDGRYASLETRLAAPLRIGLFPDDMQLLYKWYFRPQEESPDAG
ncbi:MAG: hypothetical protein JSW65_07140 [Candidatus Bipolaricaulota bacterium]|nr:MAG: hypothetical protein JSW65_07140 [Candidatus Bipolaricaulota bacterium]